MVSFAKAATAAKPTTHMQAPPKASAAPKPASGAMGFLKVGKAAHAVVETEEAKAEMAKAAAGRMWRYMMAEGEDAQITFLDGNLDDDGMLDTPVFYEHMIRLNGSWTNFVCTAEEDQTQPCPICESGERSTLVQVFTVIDHRVRTIQKGPNAGKEISNTRKLFIAKAGTRKLLGKLAAKRGGLAGCTFDVSRTGDKTPAVGDQFDFVTKYVSPEDIAAKYDMKIEDCAPGDYAEEIKYLSPEELIALGVGKAPAGLGYGSKTTSAPKGKLADEL